METVSWCQCFSNSTQETAVKRYNFDLYTRERWLVLIPGFHFQRGFRFKIVLKSAKALKKFASSPSSHSNHADYANCAPFQSDSMPLHQLRIARHCATNQEMHFITCDAIYIKSYFLEKKKLPKIFDCATSAALYMRVI